MSDETELRAGVGFVEARVKVEFPGLRLVWVTAAAPQRRSSRSSRELERRLGALSNRYRGSSVVAMRTQPIPHAYRAFYRQIGLDPDVTRVPSEQAAVSRLLKGQFASQDVLRDALLLALLETGVPVWALDAALVDPGGLGIRTTHAGEKLGSGTASAELPEGRLVIADESRIHALLFGDLPPNHRPGPRTERLALFAVGVEGVPAIHLEEAIWVCVEVLESA
jgi:DNA/RNA-binding domain of Phe-tRNA-synthetase-like protein